jgi:hypothetical protein
VATAAGPRRIEEVRAGELVRSFDFATGQWVVGRVELNHSADYTGQFLSLELEGGQRLEVTADHPIWVVAGEELEGRPELKDGGAWEDSGQALPGRWVFSQDLRVGDRLFTCGGRALAIIGLLREWKTERVYNLAMVGRPYYAVAETGLLVHNSQTGGSRGKGKKKPDDPAQKKFAFPEPTQETPSSAENQPTGDVKGKGGQEPPATPATPTPRLAPGTKPPSRTDLGQHVTHPKGQLPNTGPWRKNPGTNPVTGAGGWTDATGQQQTRIFVSGVGNARRGGFLGPYEGKGAIPGITDLNQHHPEVQMAYFMRQQGITRGELWINDPQGPCGLTTAKKLGCTLANLEKILPAGSTLDIYWRNAEGVIQYLGIVGKGK